MSQAGRTVDDVIASFVAGDIPTRDRRKDGVTSRTNYSGANVRGYASPAAARRSRVGWTCPCGAELASEVMARSRNHTRGHRHQEWERAYVAGEVDRAQ